ncbi:MAG: bifunctional hydroxymethylpyrimidine kinase/phosphomethylpyrimidine kinase [Maricaulaceae bacterium]|nr:bifunctional hydroxymethylpyrimidine kinase/phosphomethylpyrimidine kinase [Maricaulaceae bacterium]
METGEAKGRVLIVAGSDSGGGAGIQADIKAVTVMGGYAMTAITAVTVQNTLGVTGVHAIPEAVIAAQMRACLTDIGADAVKTGMLATQGVVETVADVLAELAADIPLVLDPVMVATSGDRLVDDAAADAIRARLLPMAHLVTPNIPEAEALTGLKIVDAESQARAGEALLALGARAALVKGGHMAGETVRDLLVTRAGLRAYERPRIDTRNTHGTGCTLASAIAALVARGKALPEAVQTAGDYLHEAIARAPGLGAGAGPVDHGWPLR